MALGKQLETDSFMELLFSLVGCLADWEFVALLFKSVVHKVTTTMMITGMVEIMVIYRTLTGQILERPIISNFILWFMSRHNPDWWSP